MTFKVEVPDLRQMREIVGMQRANQAMASSMNSVIGKARRPMVDAVRKEYNVRAKAVRERTIIFRKALPQKLAAQLIGVGARIPVGDFGRPIQGARGTSVSIKKGKRTLYPSAFRATVFGRGGASAGQAAGRRGRQSVWWRATKKRLPIFEPLGPSVAHMYVDDDVQRQVNQYVQRELPIDFGIRVVEGARRRIRSARKRIIP